MKQAQVIYIKQVYSIPQMGVKFLIDNHVWSLSSGLLVL